MDPERTASSPNVNLDGCFLVDSLRNNDDVIETSDVLPMKLMSITCHIVTILSYLETKAKESSKIDEEAILT